MSNLFFENTSEAVDFIRGNEVNHSHFKEQIVFLKNGYFIASIDTKIQSGDNIYLDDTKLYVIVQKKFDDYMLFKITKK